MDEPKLKEILEEFVTELLAILEETQGGALPLEEEEGSTTGLLSKRTLLEIVSHEGIVLEAYKDSVGIWTWGIGVTDMSGHGVQRYKDNPQSISKVLEIFNWLVETQYLPDVVEVLGEDLTEEQLAAALSFHYNTGAIKRASWVKSFKRGQIAKAKREIMNWRKPAEIISRRTKERDLFFDGEWSNDGTTTVFTKVRKPSYAPNWSSAKKIDISEEI